MLIKGLVRVMVIGRRKSDFFLEFVMLVDSRLQDKKLVGKRKQLV
jgi:hypothetical protein